MTQRPSSDHPADQRRSTQPITRFVRNEWLRAFVLAVAALLLVHLFIVSFVVVGSTSMFATVRPGDLLLLERYAAWTGMHRGDVVVFRDPLKDHLARWRRPLLVKRLVALPGDTVELRAGRLFVNGRAAHEPPGMTMSHLVRLRASADQAAFFERHGLPRELERPGRDVLELPLNDALAKVIEHDPVVLSVSPMRLATGSPAHIFPYSPRFPWNSDDYGPIRVPMAGDTLRITVDNLPLYDRIISVYEGHQLGHLGNALTMDGAPLTAYIVEEDYGFVLGDARHFSADSRYWGFLPMNQVVGRGGPVLLSKGDV